MIYILILLITVKPIVVLINNNEEYKEKKSFFKIISYFLLDTEVAENTTASESYSQGSMGSNITTRSRSKRSR